MDSQDRPSIVVATHGHCFDGMCSAALFTRLAKVRIAEEHRSSIAPVGTAPSRGA